MTALPDLAPPASAPGSRGRRIVPRLADLTIGSKTLIIVAVMAAWSSAISGYGTWSMITDRSRLDHLRAADQAAIDASTMRRLIIALNRGEYQMAANPQITDSLTGPMDKDMAAVLDLVKTMAADRVIDADSAAGAEADIASYGKNLKATIVAASAAMYNPDARDDLLDAVLNNRDVVLRLEKLAQTVADRTIADTLAYRDAAFAASRRAIALMIAAAVFALAFGIGIALLIARRGIVAPLKRNIALLRRLGDGDAAVEIADDRRRDEIGDIAAAMRLFRDALRGRARLEAETRALHEHEARRAAELDRLAREFERSAQAIAADLVRASGLLESEARQMTGIAAQASDRSNDTAAAARQSGEAVASVAAATEQMAASIAGMVRQVVELRDIAADANAGGRRSADGTRHLTEAVDGIQEIAGFIRQIAQRTNLLALNATIEAARAGEAGKGFSIVAGEVKLLADQVAKATDDIGGRLHDIKGMTTASMAEVRRMQAMTAKLDEACATLGAAVEEQSRTINEISQRMSEAASSTDRVTDNIAVVSVEVGRAAGSAGTVQHSAREVSAQADRLRRDVAAYLESIALG